MASAQGNSVTGVMSIIFYVFMFFILMNIIIQGTFNQIMDLSDDVIGWVGSVGKNTAGRGAEDKVHGGFVAVGRVTGGAGKVPLGAGKPKPDPDDSKK